MLKKMLEDLDKAKVETGERIVSLQLYVNTWVCTNLGMCSLTF